MEYRSDLKYHTRTVNPEELMAGAICWLPQRFYNDESITCAIHTDCYIDRNLSIREGIYRHPVVVLRTWQRPGSDVPGDLLVCFTDMTTFDKTPLSIHSSCQHLIKFATSTPVRQTVPQPGDPFMLDLAPGSESLIGQCYIRRQHAWVIPAQQLWNYRWKQSHAYSVRLFRDSYLWLTNQIGVEPEFYEDIPTSLANSRKKLAWLASKEHRRIKANAGNWQQEVYENRCLNFNQQTRSWESAMPSPNSSFPTSNKRSLSYETSQIMSQDWDTSSFDQNSVAFTMNEEYIFDTSGALGCNY